MTIHEAHLQLRATLSALYDQREAESITDWAMEHLTGRKKTERILHKDLPLSESSELAFREMEEELRSHRPVQYVLGEAWFMGMKFYVDARVLIPRPETEELVGWILDDARGDLVLHLQKKMRILDVGTGSGCIALALNRKLPEAEIWSCDISTDALVVARLNAEAVHAMVNFVHLDFLDPSQRDQLPFFNLIVSNPPYIPTHEKNIMAAHVTQFEPAAALFVPDDDPLVFYRAIANFAESHLMRPGTIYMETHEDLALDVKKLFQERNWEVTVRKDMYEKNRLVKASK